jgi:predicted RNase H-like HicB family nuclease
MGCFFPFTLILFTTMKTIRYTYWQEKRMWLGYLAEYPDYWTQGKTLKALQENLVDIYRELNNIN